eukprot:6110858-Pleurochrysis_carterae.AAC.1
MVTARSREVARTHARTHASGHARIRARTRAHARAHVCLKCKRSRGRARGWQDTDAEPTYKSTRVRTDHGHETVLLKDGAPMRMHETYTFA